MKKFISKQLALQSFLNTKDVLFFEKIILKGIGFKLFSYKDYLAFDLGTSNILLLKNKNDSIVLKLVKNQVYLFSTDLVQLQNFCYLLTTLIKPNKYKGKGVFKASTIIKLKVVKVK